MVESLGIIDIPEIAKFISNWEIDPTVTIRRIMSDSRSHILRNKDKDIYYLLQAKSNRVAIQHIYVAPGARGKKMFRFIDEVKQWGKENTEFRFIFNYTNDDRVKRIMPLLGGKYLGDLGADSIYRVEI